MIASCATAGIRAIMLTGDQRLTAEAVGRQLRLAPESIRSRVRRGRLGAYLWTVWHDGPGPRATTIAFVALVLIHPLQAMNCRSERLGWWRLPSNGLAWAALVVLAAVQWAAVEWTSLARLLGTVSLSASDRDVVMLGLLCPVLLLEALKAVRARVGRR